MHFGSI
jgi:hypothetical protein